MKTMQPTLAVLVVAALVAPGSAHALTKAQVEGYLAAANQGCFLGADPGTTGRIAGADREVTVVRYGTEGCFGGNNHAAPIAVLFDAGGGRIGSYPVAVTMGDVDRYEIDASGRLVVRTVEHGPTDPRCCPSRKRTYTLAIRNGKLAPAQ